MRRCCNVLLAVVATVGVVVLGIACGAVYTTNDERVSRATRHAAVVAAAIIGFTQYACDMTAVCLDVLRGHVSTGTLVVRLLTAANAAAGIPPLALTGVVGYCVTTSSHMASAHALDAIRDLCVLVWLTACIRFTCRNRVLMRHRIIDSFPPPAAPIMRPTTSVADLIDRLGPSEDEAELDDIIDCIEEVSDDDASDSSGKTEVLPVSVTRSVGRRHRHKAKHP